MVDSLDNATKRLRRKFDQVAGDINLELAARGENRIVATRLGNRLIIKLRESPRNIPEHSDVNIGVQPKGGNG